MSSPETKGVVFNSPSLKREAQDFKEKEDNKVQKADEEGYTVNLDYSEPPIPHEVRDNMLDNMPDNMPDGPLDKE